MTDYIFLHRFGEGGPARTGFKLEPRIEKLRPTTNAGIHSRLVRLAIFAAKRRFRPVLPRDAELLRRQHLPPFTFSLIDLPIRRGILFCVVQYVIPVHANSFVTITLYALQTFPPNGIFCNTLVRAEEAICCLAFIFMGSRTLRISEWSMSVLRCMVEWQNPYRFNQYVNLKTSARFLLTK